MEAKEPQWAIVELMGHVRLAGKLSEEEHFGRKMGRIDIPMVAVCEKCNGKRYEIGGIGPLGQEQHLPCETCQETGQIETYATKLFGGESVYCISFVSEEVARTVKSGNTTPVKPWEFPKAIGTSKPSTFFDQDDETDNIT